ncbi:unnamed protein product [Schistosoma mattheei]|uniref:Uncharacterized protein n=1 Tax=Schistosoma mattheei TaxID=31246 RepID=A0A3P8CWN6_9TREM|nr:unnamed protein product [Schistosoma mattheei]
MKVSNYGIQLKNFGRDLNISVKIKFENILRKMI